MNTAEEKSIGRKLTNKLDGFVTAAHAANYVDTLKEIETTIDALTEANARMRAELNTAATAFRTGFLPPEDWLARAHELLGLPPTDQKCSQRESGDVRKLRRMLAFAYSQPGALYGDDGELCDASCRPFIDFVRMTVDEIQQAIEARGRAALKGAK